jgi:predicted TIM-barrel fold metal-dependent hydrolase
MISYRGEQIEVWDAHAHMGPREQVAIHQIPRIMAFMPDEMIARMDESGVDVVTPFPIGAGNKTDYAELNRLMAKAARDYPGRMVGYMRLNPNYGVEHNRRLVEEGVGLGLRGIKLHPLIEHFEADDRELVYPIVEQAEQHGLVVIFHCGLGEAASPDRVARVARDFPRVSVIAGHSGLIEGLRRVVEHAKELPNLHMDSSGVGWIPYFCESVSWAGPDRVLYGSDTPFNHMKMELDKIIVYANAHLQLPTEDLRLVLSGNLKRLLRLA